jgi:hypothetical protein
MKQKEKIFLGLLAGLIFVSLAFQVLTKPELIRQKVDEKVDIFIRVHRKECQERVLEKASAIVDSMLIERVRSSRDTINKPPKPLKPEKPDPLSPMDSMDIHPLFNGDTPRSDTLN